MPSLSDLDLVIECLGKVLSSCNDRCVNCKGECHEIYNKAVKIVTNWQAIVSTIGVSNGL